ncbi:MAG: MFS transporter [Pseudomonadota bacterium]
MRSLRNHNYRLWAVSAFVSNIGTWMQRVAQDWLVLAVLTHGAATSVGIVTALQFAPQIFLLPLTGAAAEYLDRRKLLIATQGSMVALAFGLGILTVFGWVQLWEVYVFAFLLGCVTAFDAPARQVFVSELVGDADLSNAVALNSTSFNAARMIGPAIAGALIAAVGIGWAFLLNGAATLAVVAALFMLRVHELHRDTDGPRPAGGFIQAMRYLFTRGDLQAILVMLALFGAFGLNFPVFISTMAVNVFRVDASHFGLLTSAMAIGSVTGAVLAARRERPDLIFIIAGAATFSIGLATAALMPTYWAFGAVLVIVGVAAQTVTTSAIGLVQLATDKHMRGRMMALLMAITLGSAALGAPILGWVADLAGPRWALGVAAAAAAIAAAIGLRHHRRAGSVAVSAPTTIPTIEPSSVRPA